METLEIPAARLSTSVLGLGCAGLGGRLDARESREVLEAAVSAGIRYFDVARSYGYGGAEGVLGRFLIGLPRDNFTIATKAGIAPGLQASQTKIVRKLVRGIGASHPLVRRQISRIARRDAVHGQFSVANLETSFNVSLKQLNTDYVDVLHLHDCSPSDLNDEVHNWVEGQVAKGKARMWGIATSNDFAQTISSRRSVDVVQVAAPVGQELPDSLKSNGPHLRNQHSVLREDYRAVKAYLATPGVAQMWRDAFEAPVSLGSVPILLLEYALSRSPEGVVLVGTQSPTHAAALAKVQKANATKADLISRLLSDARRTSATEDGT